MPETRDATPEDLPQIVSIHMAAFPGFFLTRLGPGFLRELYLGFLNTEAGTITLVCEGGTVLGFAAGTFAPESFFRRLRADRWFSFLLKATPGLLKSPGMVISKLWRALRYRGDSAEGRPGGALLSSLAVSPRAQQKGVGRLLVDRFCELSRQRAKTYVYVITDKDENRAIIRFYEKLGFVADAILTKENERQMYRLTKCLQEEDSGA